MEINNNLDIAVSVVIPTLGEEILEKTIHQLNLGTLVPNEILVCIPSEHVHKTNNINFNNVTILETSFSGQVAQRAEGFKKAKGEIVVQLDGDVHLDETCLYSLVKTLKSMGGKTCVAPVMYDLATGKATSSLLEKNWSNRIYYWIINGSSGFIPGSISKSGAGMGIVFDSEDKGKHTVEWMPGGCIAHYKDNLILDNYYPFKGKAFCEDMIHCILLSKKGCSLIIDAQARCGVEIPASENLDFLPYIKEHFSGYKARKYFVKFSGNSLFRMNLYYFSMLLNHFLRLIKKKI